MFAVTVTFQIEPDRIPDFLPLLHANAQTSLAIEDGCHQFDVATDPQHPHEVFLYELYTNRAAFDAHLGSPHFKAFDAQVVDMIAHKSVKTFAEVQQ